MVDNAYHNWNHVVDVTQVRRTALLFASASGTATAQRRRRCPAVGRLTRACSRRAGGRGEGKTDGAPADVSAAGQTVFCLARASGQLESLTDKQRLTLFLAALCHDLEHPVRSGGGQRACESAVAARGRAVARHRLPRRHLAARAARRAVAPPRRARSGLQCPRGAFASRVSSSRL